MENNQPAPSRVSKRIKLARAAQEKLRPRSNESLAALPTKSAFIQSVVSALPSRDESFFSMGEGTTTRCGPVSKQLGGGALRPYMATNAEDAAPPKGQVIGTRPNDIHVRELLAIARRKEEAEAKEAATAKRLAAAAKKQKQKERRKKKKAGGAAAATAAGGGGGSKAAGSAAKRPPRGGRGGGAGPSSAAAAATPREPLATAPLATRDNDNDGA